MPEVLVNDAIHRVRQGEEMVNDRLKGKEFSADDLLQPSRITVENCHRWRAFCTVNPAMKNLVREKVRDMEKSKIWVIRR